MVMRMLAVATTVAFAWSVSLCGAAESLRATTPRRLAYEMIANYEPTSLVTSHNAIDLDQQSMEILLAANSLDRARHFYQDGAHSKNYAQLNLTTPLANDIPAETVVKGTAFIAGNEAKGTMLEAAFKGNTKIKVQYHIYPVQATYSNCQVGALYHITQAHKDGCFVESGTVEIEGFGTHNYTYDIHKDNLNARTLKGFSTGAAATMQNCPTCPYPTFEKFFNYYGVADYGDKWVEAAFDGVATQFMNGNVNFSGMDAAYRGEAIQKGTAYMIVWMYVIREMEDAIDDCIKNDITDNYDEVHAWDEAVAFFTGSLEGTGGSGGGNLIFSLINKRCVDFLTCGVQGGEASGHAKINHDIRKLFKEGQKKLSKGECEEVRGIKKEIENLMVVPLVQGTLRYAHILGTSATKDPKSAAEGATFAAAVLPIVHHCNPTSAEAIYANMKLDAQSTSFAHVKNAFEENYGCMGIIGEDVGGVYNNATATYFEGAEPCSGDCSDGGGNSSAVGVAIGVTAGVVIALLGIMFFLRYKKRHSADTKPTANPVFVQADDTFIT